MQAVTTIKQPKKLTTLNLNRASYRELVRLPGIGDTLARRIIEYRQRNGGFRRIEDLVHSVGLHQRRFEQIIDRLEI
jgi:competence protein ComEA